MARTETAIKSATVNGAEKTKLSSIYHHPIEGYSAISKWEKINGRRIAHISFVFSNQ